jgi:hypothetical protein
MKFFIGMALAAAGLLAGCGGGGSGSSNRSGITRTLVGYVYVKNALNPSTSAPDVIVTPASTPPPGLYDVPISGTATLIAQNGHFLLTSSGSNNNSVFTKNMADGNDIVVMVTTEQGSPTIDITAGNITSGSGLKSLAQYQENLNDGFASGTTKVLSSPNNPDTRKADRTQINMVKFTLDGIMPSNPTTDILAGEKRYLAMAYLDVNGIAIPGVPAIGSGVSFAVDDPAKINIDSTTNLVIPAFQGQLPGTVNISASVSNPAITGSLSLEYQYGAPATVTIAKDLAGTAISSPIDLRWSVVTDPADTNVPERTLMVATVTNKYGAGIPDTTVNWSNIKAPLNEWTTSVGGPCFLDVTTETAATSSVTDINGKAQIYVTTPPPADGDLGGTASPPKGSPGVGDSRPKGENHVYATAAGTVITNLLPAKFRITRDMATIKIREKDTLSNQTLDILSDYTYHAYGTDVDNDDTDDPPGATWKISNVVGSSYYGNGGDNFRVNVPNGHYDTQTTSEATITGGVVSSGAVAGRINISLAYPGLTADTYTADIIGRPIKLHFVVVDNTWDTNPWEAGQGTSRPAPDNSLQGDFLSSQWIPDTATPPTYHIFVYLYLMDSYGHILPHTNSIPVVSTTDPFDNSAVFTDPLNIYNGSINKVTAPGGSPGDPCYDLHPGPGGVWGIHWEASGVYKGYSGNLTIPFTIASLIPTAGPGIWPTGYKPGKDTKVHN